MRMLCSGWLKTSLIWMICLTCSISIETLAQTLRVTSPDELTTRAERADFCTQMREATTHTERQAVAQRWHELMAARAKERGVESPPHMGQHQPMMGYDGGMPMGMGMNCGRAVVGMGKSIPLGVVELPVNKDRGIAYVTGGVGEDEAAAMRSVASRYSMRARFTMSTGEFVSDVSVRVSKADGKLIFAAISDGPYLYAQVPPGRYVLSATLNGIERSRSFDIPKRGGINVSLMWPPAQQGKGG